MLLYLGIIDILQSYRLKKKLEHSLKAFITDGVRTGGGEGGRTGGRGGEGSEGERGGRRKGREEGGGRRERIMS